MPLDLGDHAASLLPGPGLVAEASMNYPDLVRRSFDGAGHQMRDLLLQIRVGRQADRVSVNRGTEMGAVPYKSGLGFRNRAGLGGGSHAVKSGHLFNGRSAN